MILMKFQASDEHSEIKKINPDARMQKEYSADWRQCDYDEEMNDVCNTKRYGKLTAALTI